MPVYYNEIDPFAAAWLRNLIAAGHIAPGDVDERSIAEVSPDDLKGYEQAHFFAGIGGWSLAARLAGIPDDFPLWTGSCPCQPFSSAGKRRGVDDERHLWPEFYQLIAERRPAIVAGEQVASKAGRSWLAGVRADLEALDYGVGAADLCAAGVGAPHIRQRLWWVADAGSGRRDGWAPDARRKPERGVAVAGAGEGGGRVADGDGARSQAHRRHDQRNEARREGDEWESCSSSSDSRLAYPDHQRHDRQHALLQRDEPGRDSRNCAEVAGSGESGERLGDARSAGFSGHRRHEPERNKPGRDSANAVRSIAETGGNCWSEAIYTPCADGKARRIEPSIEPLVDGLPRGVVPSSRQGMEINANATAEGRQGRLKAYGNAIVPQVAAEFLIAAFEAIEAS